MEELDGYFFINGVLMYCKYCINECNGIRYVDCIVVLELYRNEILWVGYIIFLFGYMGRNKMVEWISVYFFWFGLYFDVCKYCVICL